MVRVKVYIRGVVQGVGFRPFIFRLAEALGLKGYVLNSEQGVVVEAEGEEEALREFLLKVQADPPPASRIFSMEYKFLPPAGYREFRIERSEKRGKPRVCVLPDLATCKDCLRELFDPSDRRFRYPFINCTNCGPRFTIIERLPYDRKNTSMRKFKMCKKCLSEYTDPADRRFHAQPNACPACGPKVFFLDPHSGEEAEGERAIKRVVECLKAGKIVAVKGLGGFHLLCDATSEDAVENLRRRKRREEKPFAVMFPDIDSVKAHAHVSALEERALTSVEAPIVILKRKEGTALAESVAPGNATVGAFLPYTPLHHIILSDFSKPLVATSANLSEEPIVKDNREALSTLKGIADAFLLHNRDIVRRCDDSVLMVVAGRQVPIRRSRGFAPLPVLLPFRLKSTVLALGPYMKNTVALAKENRVYISQHVGDIDNAKAERFFAEVVRDMLELFEAEPEVVVCDRHPLYYSTKFAMENFAGKVVQMYHHHAHIASCMAENEVPEGAKVLGVAFDGTGYGKDGTIWGGEFLFADYLDFERMFHLKEFLLPGGDRAVKEPYRVAVSLLKEVGREPEGLIPVEQRKLSFVSQMLEKGFGVFVTSSMGRLFDGISSILGIRQVSSYHAQPAILLEQSAWQSNTQEAYTFSIRGEKVDWRSVVEEVLRDIGNLTVPEIARKFHNGVCRMVVDVLCLMREETGTATVALSGGVFQNRLLTECVCEKLKDRGFTVLLHQMVPPNDGGVSLGQAVFGGLR